MPTPGAAGRGSAAAKRRRPDQDRDAPPGSVRRRAARLSGEPLAQGRRDGRLVSCEPAGGLPAPRAAQSAAPLASGALRAASSRRPHQARSRSSRTGQRPLPPANLKRHSGQASFRGHRPGGTAGGVRGRARPDEIVALRPAAPSSPPVAFFRIAAARRVSRALQGSPRSVSFLWSDRRRASRPCQGRPGARSLAGGCPPARNQGPLLVGRQSRVSGPCRAGQRPAMTRPTRTRPTRSPTRPTGRSRVSDPGAGVGSATRDHEAGGLEPPAGNESRAPASLCLSGGDPEIGRAAQRPAQ